MHGKDIYEKGKVIQWRTFRLANNRVEIIVVENRLWSQHNLIRQETEL